MAESLDAYAPDPQLEHHIRAIVADATKQRLAPFIEDLQKIKEAVAILIPDVQKLTTRIDAAAELIEKVNRENEAALDAMAEIRSLQALQDIAAGVNGILEFKKEFAAQGPAAYRRENGPDEPQPKQHGTRDYHSELAEAGVDMTLVDVKVDGGVAYVTPKKFLGDLWGPIMEAVKSLGGEWIRDDKNSHWKVGVSGRTSPSPRTQSGGSTPQIREPNAPASEKQIALLKKLNVYVKPGLTKGEASKLIEANKKW